MKRAIIIFTLLQFYFVTMLTAQQSVTSFDGQPFSVGDKIQLGYANYNADEYRTIKFQPKEGSYFPQVKTRHLPLSFVTIEKIITESDNKVFYDSEPVIVVSSEILPGENLFIHLNDAITRGEIISKTSDNPLQKTAKLLTLDKMIACCLRVNKLPVTDDAVLQYIKAIDADLGKECDDNKFTFQKLKDEYKGLLEKEMNEFDFSKTYSINVPGSRGEYDFDKKGYPLGNNIRNPYHPNYFIEHNGFNFFVDVNDKYFFLPLLPELAENFELRKKGFKKGGYADSLLYLTYFLKLKDKRMELPKEKVEVIDKENLYRHTLIGSTIVEIDVFDHPSFQYNYIGTVK